MEIRKWICDFCGSEIEDRRYHIPNPNDDDDDRQKDACKECLEKMYSLLEKDLNKKSKKKTKKKDEDEEE